MYYIRAVTSENGPSDIRSRIIGSESQLSGYWIGKYATFLPANNEDSDQTTLMRMLIRVFFGSTYQKVRFFTYRLIMRERERIVTLFILTGTSQKISDQLTPAFNPATLKRVIGNECIPRSDAASDQSRHCLH